MKKRNIILLVVFALTLLILWIFNRPESLGNITQKFNEAATSSANITFSGEANERIKFSFKSNIESGELDIILYDSTGNVVYELDKAKELETYFTFEKTDTYILKAEYVDFVGEYKVEVYKAN